jgi:hypothetical protein
LFDALGTADSVLVGTSDGVVGKLPTIRSQPASAISLGAVRVLRAAGVGQNQMHRETSSTANSTTDKVYSVLDHLEHLLSDMNDRLRRIEASMTGSKSD